MLANNHRLFGHITNSLYLELKETKKINNKDYDQLLHDLCSRVNRPTVFQENYQPIFNGEVIKKIDLRVSKETIFEFNTFAAAFESNYHALDFLINAEKSSRFGHLSIS